VVTVLPDYQRRPFIRPVDKLPVFKLSVEIEQKLIHDCSTQTNGHGTKRASQ